MITTTCSICSNEKQNIALKYCDKCNEIINLANEENIKNLLNEEAQRIKDLKENVFEQILNELKEIKYLLVKNKPEITNKIILKD